MAAKENMILWTGRIKCTQSTEMSGVAGPADTTYSPLYSFGKVISKNGQPVDPRYKRKAGPYKFLSNFTWTPPYVNATLTYEQRFGPVSKTERRLYGPFNGKWYVPTPLKTTQNWNRPSLINAALDGISDETVNLAIFFKELERSMQLVSSIAKRTADSAFLIKGNKFKAAAKLLGIATPRGAKRSKQFADNYLEFTFGVLPLLSDLDGVLKHLATRARKLRIFGRARHNETKSGRESTNTVLFNHGYQNETGVLLTSDWITKIYEQVTIEYQLSAAHWDEYSRLGFTNSGVATWDSIPYSFVVDTFLNVGQWLGNMDLGLGLELVTASYTQGNRSVGALRAYGTFVNLPSSSQIKNARITQGPYQDGVFSASIMERTVLTQGDLLYTLMFRSPYSVNNAITNTALVYQRVDFTRR